MGKSGSFYFGYIGHPNEACAASILKSTDNGRTLSFRGNAVLCPVKGGCSVDQPQITVDRSNQANGQDQIYAVWRNKTAMSPETPCGSIAGVEQPRIVCSSNGGTSFIAPVSVGTGQRPRVVVGGDGFVYVTYMTPSSILLNKYSSCASGLQQQRGFPVTVTSYNPVRCPVTGLDRCSNGLSSPMVAVDDQMPSHVYITWATDRMDDVETIKVADSLDGGKTFPRKVTVSDSVARRRFMPWICTTRSVAYLGWYDRYYTTTANNDLTRYFGASVASDGVSLVANTVFDFSGVDDAQCRLWPCAPDNTFNATTRSVQPQLAGICSAPAGKRCDYSNPSAYCAAGATCQTARGCPKYGDYNGIGCAAGNVYRAWAAGAPPPGVTAPGTSVKLYARTSKPRVVNFIARHSNKCLDVKDDSKADGAPLVQFRCGSGMNQQFELIPTGSYYQIVARSSGKCVEVRAASGADKAVIQQLSCNGGANQRFQLVDMGGGFNKLVIRGSGKCVDVDGASTADLALILQLTCNGQTNQQFRLQGVTRSTPARRYDRSALPALPGATIPGRRKKGDMTNEELFAKTTVNSWKLAIDRLDKTFSSLSDVELQTRVAPGRNRVFYLLGHLTAVHDRLFPMLGFGERLHPELDEDFLTNPDGKSPDRVSAADLRHAWSEVNQKLMAAFVALPAEWLKKHAAVSEEDFAKEPHRNRLAVLQCRTLHAGVPWRPDRPDLEAAGRVGQGAKIAAPFCRSPMPCRDPCLAPPSLPPPVCGPVPRRPRRRRDVQLPF